MSPAPIPKHILRIEWQMLRMVGNFDEAVTRPDIRRTLEMSARAREERDQRRARDRRDIKRLACGDLDD